MTIHTAPSPNDDAFEFWVRATALDAAIALMQMREQSRFRNETLAANATMDLVQRFEMYLNTGKRHN